MLDLTVGWISWVSGISPINLHMSVNRGLLCKSFVSLEASGMQSCSGKYPNLLEGSNAHSKALFPWPWLPVHRRAPEKVGWLLSRGSAGLQSPEACVPPQIRTNLPECTATPDSFLPHLQKHNTSSHQLLLSSCYRARNWFSALHTFSQLILTWGRGCFIFLLHSGNSGTERLSNLPKVTQWVIAGAEVRTQADCCRASNHSLFASPPSHDRVTGDKGSGRQISLLFDVTSIKVVSHNEIRYFKNKESHPVIERLYMLCAEDAGYCGPHEPCILKAWSRLKPTTVWNLLPHPMFVILQWPPCVCIPLTRQYPGAAVLQGEDLCLCC